MMKKNLTMNQVRGAAAGSVAAVMWREVAVRPPTCRVCEAIERVRQVGLPDKDMGHCYVVTEKYCLLGQVGLRELLLTRGGAHLESIMTHPFATLHPEDDQELAAQLMQAYNLTELPVVDEEDRLVGVVAADAAMAVKREEATEDMERMVAMSPSEQPYLEAAVVRIFLAWIPWLLVLMLSATLTGGIISHFEEALAAQVALTAYIPMLMDTGGNCGSQSSVTVIRGLSLGEVKFSDWFRVLWKEIRVSVLCALALAAVNFLRLLALGSTGAAVAATVSLALVATVILTDLVGGFLPILARRMGLDPAVMASPLITTIVDALSLLVYFQVASWILNI